MAKAVIFPDFLSSRLQKQQVQIRVAAGAGGGEGADETQGIVVFALAAFRPAFGGRAMGRAQIRDEERRLRKSRQLLESLHHTGAGEKRRSAGVVTGSVPVEKTVTGLGATQP